jgi:hypothetical protein
MNWKKIGIRKGNLDRDRERDRDEDRELKMPLRKSKVGKLNVSSRNRTCNPQLRRLVLYPVEL